MIDGYPRVLTIVCAVGAGLTGGVFFAFSTFVMAGLRRLPAGQGMSAMQAINRTAETPAFLTALLGTAVACLVLAISAVRRLGEPVAVYQLVGSVLYIASIAITVIYHVPRNNALGLINAQSASAAEAWNSYLPGWTAWNHVRTLVSLAGAATLILAVHAD
jgi:uncharacterized membrane protein